MIVSMKKHVRRNLNFGDKRQIVIISSACILIIISALIAVSVKKRIDSASKIPTEVIEEKIERTAQVEITKDGFVPATLVIKKNTQVIFKNTDSKFHRVASDPYPINDKLPDFNSQNNIASDGTYSFLFKEIGTWTYHDDLTPFDFVGTIVVVEE